MKIYKNRKLKATSGAERGYIESVHGKIPPFMEDYGSDWTRYIVPVMKGEDAGFYKVERDGLDASASTYSPETLYKMIEYLEKAIVKGIADIKYGMVYNTTLLKRFFVAVYEKHHSASIMFNRRVD